MGQHDIGDYFKDRVKGHNKDIDTNAVWANLDLGQQKKKKRGAWWMWFMGTGIMLLVPTLAYFTYQNKTNPESKNNLSIEINNQQDSHASTSAPLKEETIGSTQQPAPKTALTQNQNNSSTLPLSKESDTKASTPTTEVIRLNKINTTHTTSESTQTKNKTSSPESNSIKEKSTATRSKISEALIQHTNEFPNSKLSIQKEKSHSHKTNPLLVLNPIQLQNELLFINYTRLEAPELTTPIFYPIESEIESSPKKAGQLSLEIYTGVFAINRTLQDTDGNFPLGNIKEENETTLEMISIGSQLQYKWANNLYAKAGLEIQSINERYKHQSTTIDTITTENQPTTYFVSSANDTTVHATGMGQSVRQLDEHWTFYNNHRLLTIPLSIGYLKENNKWAYSIEGTLLTSIYNKFNGTTLAIDGSRTTNPSYLSTRVKLGYRFSLSLERQLNEHLSMYLKPSYQAYGTSFAEGFSQKYAFMGGLIGFRYGL